MTEIISVLRLVSDSISDSDIIWALTGSLAFHIRGIDVSVGDIDIQTDNNGAYEIGRRLMNYVVNPVEFRASERIRSHFGQFQIDGISVEVMGDIEKLMPDGTWLSTPPLESIIEYVTYQDMIIPVLELEYEYQAYKLMGRTARAECLRKWIEIGHE